MPTIVGPTLPEPHSSTVESIRGELVEEFGVDPYPNPNPHFTLYPLDDEVPPGAVESAVRDATAGHDPVSVRTDGVGVFPGNHVWLPVAKSPRLTSLHADVVEAVTELGTAPMPYYDPHRWFPHVGFALGVDDDLAGELVTHLLEYDLAWEVTVDNVTVTRLPADGGNHEVVASVDL